MPPPPHPLCLPPPDSLCLPPPDSLCSPLPSWLARTDPRDVARVESKTDIATQNERDTVPSPRGGGGSQLGRWMSQEEFDKAVTLRFPGCMKGTQINLFC